MFLFFYQIVSTFISHTIASLLLVPIAKEVASNLPGHHRNLLIFITALICSAGMGMPVSGFPNQTALVFCFFSLSSRAIFAKQFNFLSFVELPKKMSLVNFISRM